VGKKQQKVLTSISNDKCQTGITDKSAYRIYTRRTILKAAVTVNIMPTVIKDKDKEIDYKDERMVKIKRKSFSQVLFAVTNSKNAACIVLLFIVFIY